MDSGSTQAKRFSEHTTLRKIHFTNQVFSMLCTFDFVKANNAKHAKLHLIKPGVMRQLPGQELRHVLLTHSPEHLELLQVAHVGLLILPEGDALYDGRPFQFQYQVLRGGWRERQRRRYRDMSLYVLRPIL